jgi:hypothetical protein
MGRWRRSSAAGPTRRRRDGVGAPRPTNVVVRGSPSRVRHGWEEEEEEGEEEDWWGPQGSNGHFTSRFDTVSLENRWNGTRVNKLRVHDTQVAKIFYGIYVIDIFHNGIYVNDSPNLCQTEKNIGKER